MSAIALARMSNDDECIKLFDPSKRKKDKSNASSSTKTNSGFRPTEKTTEDTPLHIAAKNGDIDEVRRLLESGANPNVRNLNGETPLLSAVCSLRADILKLLLDHGANPKVGNSLGSPLAHAREYKWMDGINILEPLCPNDHSKGLTYPQEDKKKQIPLWKQMHDAAARGDIATLDSLIRSDVDINIADRHGATPLFSTLSPREYVYSGSHSFSGSTYVTRKERSVDLNEKRYKCFRWLLEKGADPFMTDSYGNSLLHRAVACNQEWFVEDLLEKGLDLNCLNNSGYAPLDVCNDPEMECLLRVKGAKRNKGIKATLKKLFHRQ